MAGTEEPEQPGKLPDDDIAARLAQMERRIHQGALQVEIGVAFSRAIDARDMLQRSTDAIVRHLGAAFARIWTTDESGAALELQASSGIYTHIDGGHARVPVGKFKIGLIAAERTPHLTNQVLGDPRVGNQAWAAREGMVAFAGYPLLMEERLVGVVAMFARHELADDVLTSLSAVADAIAIGVERKRADEARRRLEQDLRAAAATLEARVEERTEQLTQTLRELEAFSYSVSHDLRAPLRHITGYGDKLRRSLGDRATPEEKRCLSIVIDSTSRMGKLIDALLDFSRMGRVELRRDSVVTAELVREVVDEQCEELGDRRVAFDIGDLPIMRGDRAVLRQVWTNLVSNAIKYTRGRDEAHVAIRGSRVAGEIVFSVQDDGAGFDMRFVDKLFGVFQRLHGADEFEGTGIGLANVRRIIGRHGGRTWAEGTVGQGATFFFSLPSTPGEP